MKRYLVFAFDDYYPGGGWNDFVGDTDRESEAVEMTKRGAMVTHSITGEPVAIYFGNWQIIDTATGREVDPATPNSR